MTEYYVSGCIDNGSEIETCDDSEATFWTLYERDAEGLSQGIIDCKFREDAEAAMRVYQERDVLQQQVKNIQDKADFKQNLTEQVVALQQQVNALAAEVSGIKYLVMEVSDDDYAQASRRCQLLMGEIANFKTPATDAIKRQWMAEGAKDAALRIRTCEEEFPEASWDIVEECAILAESQPEEKDQ